MKQIKVYVYQNDVGTITEHRFKQQPTHGFTFLGTRTIEIEEPEEKKERLVLSLSKGLNHSTLNLEKDTILQEIHPDERVFSKDDIKDAYLKATGLNISKYLDTIIKELFK